MLSSRAAIFLIFFIQLLFYGTHGFTKTALKYYQVAHRYTCGKTYYILFERPLLFSYGEAYMHGYSINPVFVCDLHTIAKSRGSGIIATVQRLKLRRKDPTKCLDFLAYNVEGTLRCGDMKYGLNTLDDDGKVLPSPPFISLYSGPFSPGSSVSSEFVSPGNVVLPGNHLVTHINVNKITLGYAEELKIHIAYTAYLDCDANNVSKGWFNCGYGVCISERLVYDGVVNCPFGDCIDEGGCVEANVGYPQLTGMFAKRKPLRKAVERSGPPYPTSRIPPKRKKQVSATKNYSNAQDDVCTRPIIGPWNRNRPGSRTKHRPYIPKTDDVQMDQFFLKVYMNLLEKMNDKDVVYNQKKFSERVSQYIIRTHADMWNGTGGI